MPSLLGKREALLKQSDAGSALLQKYTRAQAAVSKLEGSQAYRKADKEARLRMRAPLIATRGSVIEEIDELVAQVRRGANEDVASSLQEIVRLAQNAVSSNVLQAAAAEAAAPLMNNK